MSKVSRGTTADVSDLVQPMGVLGADGKWYAMAGGATSGTLALPTGQTTAALSTPVVLASDGTMTPGTGATNLGKAEGAAHASGDVGVMALGVYNSAAATPFTATDLDYVPIAMTRYGSAHSAIGSSTLMADAATQAVCVQDVAGVGGRVLGVVPGYWTGAAIERARTPNIFRTATATASGDTAVWTPAASKKFRLMGFLIEATQDAATAGGAVITIALRDATTALNLTVSVFVPAVAATTLGAGYSSEWIDLGNGPLSAAANNVLNVNLSAALTSGTVRVIAIGTEE